MFKKVFFAALAVCVLLLASTLHFRSSYQDAQQKLAHHSYEAWGELYTLAVEAGNFSGPDELARYEIRYGAVASSGIYPYMVPSFDHSTYTLDFLSSDVYQFLQLLAQADPDNVVTQQSFELFQAMFEQIEDIAVLVLDYTNQGEAAKLELIDHDSEIYQEVSRQIDECILTYVEDIRLLIPRLSYVIETA